MRKASTRNENVAADPSEIRYTIFESVDDQMFGHLDKEEVGIAAHKSADLAANLIVDPFQI